MIYFHYRVGRDAAEKTSRLLLGVPNVSDEQLGLIKAKAPESNFEDSDDEPTGAFGDGSSSGKNSVILMIYSYILMLR